MVQFSCETDFVAKTDNFRDALSAILTTVHKEKDLVVTNDSDDKSALVKELKMLTKLDPDVDSQTIGDGIKFVISKTQENCQLSRIFRTTFDSAKGEVVATYLHNKTAPTIGKIGSVFVSGFSPSRF